MCIIRSMHADVPNHEPSLMLMNTGEARLIRPGFGSWVTYGLGTENQSLPGFISMCPRGYPIQESQNWQSGFLPSVHQGTYIDTQNTELEKLIQFIKNKHTSRNDQRKQIDFLQELNRKHLAAREMDGELDARIHPFELAYNMQMEASESFDLRKEPKHMLDLYGESTQSRQLLTALRRLDRGWQRGGAGREGEGKREDRAEDE